MMKKVFLAAFILAATASFSNPVSILNLKSGGGTHISASQVPVRILNAFNASYPAATKVEWQKEWEHSMVEYKVSFYVNGSKMTARYY
jgi:hypothetical protein